MIFGRDRGEYEILGGWLDIYSQREKALTDKLKDESKRDITYAIGDLLYDVALLRAEILTFYKDLPDDLIAQKLKDRRLLYEPEKDKFVSWSRALEDIGYRSVSIMRRAKLGRSKNVRDLATLDPIDSVFSLFDFVSGAYELELQGREE